MSDGYEITSLDEIELPAVGPSIGEHPDTSTSVASASTRTSPRSRGRRSSSDHDELSERAAQHEELYVVLSGKATFTVDGQTLDDRPRHRLRPATDGEAGEAVADEARTRSSPSVRERGEALRSFALDAVGA